MKADADAMRIQPSNTEAIFETGQVRADHYRVLARLLAGPPTAELLAVLQRIDPCNIGSAALRNRWRELKTAASQAETAALKSAYQKLFIGLGRGEVVPYACHYLTGRLMDAPLVGLRTALGQFGMVRRADLAEPEDHAAALCEVMALLCGEEESNGTVGKFFDTYVASWVPSFFKDLKHSTPGGFYRAVAAFGEDFIATEIRHYARKPSGVCNTVS